MVILFLDIETLPGHESLREHIETKVKPPGTMTKPDTIRQWEEEQKPLRIEEEYRKTSLRGHTGRILCIGYMKEAPQGATQGVLTGDECSILSEFWQLAADVHLFVGFNVLDFDLKYIWQRSVINGVPPTRPINFARYRSSPIFDVMQEWEKWGREYISLNDLAIALGIESSKGALDGSKVYDFYLEGKLQEIYDYCLADVAVTRQIFKKMNFSS